MSLMAIFMAGSFILYSCECHNISSVNTTNNFRSRSHDPTLPQQMDIGPRAPLSAIAFSKEGKAFVSVATDGEI
jgi:hypothetical protein